MAYTNTTSASSTAVLGQLLGAMNTVATRFRQYRTYRATVDGLTELSNRELADLGLSRGDIKRVALESAYR